jgi:hypothetical protein
MASQLAGEDILATDITEVTVKYINKPGNESVTSSTTLQNDDDFVVTLQPGTYNIRLILHWMGASVAAAAGDIQTAWTNTGTMTLLSRTGLGGGTNFVSATEMPVRLQGAALATALTWQGNATNSNTLIEELLITVTVAGNLQLQWAQHTTPSATATTVTTRSVMYITNVEAY